MVCVCHSSKNLSRILLVPFFAVMPPVHDSEEVGGASAMLIK
jgi:hypothetical protein